MNPELKDPVNATGTALAIIGGCMIFSLLVYEQTPEAIPIIGFILWVIGMIILFVYKRKDKD